MKVILAFCWIYYVENNSVRAVVLKEVEKTLNCYSDKNGCFVYYCRHCEKYIFQRMGCNSRLCSCCGKRYADQWALSLSKSMFQVPHRHIVISIPDILWPFLKEDRSRWKDYMDCAIELCNDYFSQLVNGNIKVGVIVVLHPFGKDMKNQPHLHLIITEGGFDKSGRFIPKYFIPADGFRKKWQYHVLKKFQEIGLDNNIATLCYEKYRKGFYAWVHRDGRISHPRLIARYLGRYVRHPAIANSRIDWFNKEESTVGFHYDDHKKRRHDVTMGTDEFIIALVQHIPPPQFKMIRYYGAYARRTKAKYGARALSSIKQLNLIHFGLEKITKCPYCGKKLEFIAYLPKPPPPDKGKLDNWIESNTGWARN